MRIVLGEKDLLRLLAGRTISKQVKTKTVEFCLQDIGWPVMEDVLDKARTGDPRIPCDTGCEAEPGHPGPCYIGGAPSPRAKGEVMTRDIERKPSVLVDMDGPLNMATQRPPSKPPRRILPVVRKRVKE
jgi:hypothetical protein